MTCRGCTTHEAISQEKAVHVAHVALQSPFSQVMHDLLLCGICHALVLTPLDGTSHMEEEETVLQLLPHCVNFRSHLQTSHARLVPCPAGVDSVDDISQQKATLPLLLTLLQTPVSQALHQLLHALRISCTSFLPVQVSKRAGRAACSHEGQKCCGHLLCGIALCCPQEHPEQELLRQRLGNMPEMEHDQALVSLLCLPAAPQGGRGGGGGGAMTVCFFHGHILGCTWDVEWLCCRADGCVALLKNCTSS